MSQKIFLSTVSSEFGMLRRRLANLTQRTKKCQVRHQDDFLYPGVKTLQKLVDEMQAVNILVHLIGDEPESCVSTDQASAFLDQQPEFQERFPEMTQQEQKGAVSAAQCEPQLGKQQQRKVIRLIAGQATKETL